MKVGFITKPLWGGTWGKWCLSIQESLNPSISQSSLVGVWQAEFWPAFSVVLVLEIVATFVTLLQVLWNRERSKLKPSVYQPQFLPLCKQTKTALSPPYTHTHTLFSKFYFVWLFHAFVSDVRRLDTRSFTNHFMWIQQVTSGLLPLPSIHLKSLLCSNGTANSTVKPSWWKIKKCSCSIGVLGEDVPDWCKSKWVVWMSHIT